MEEILNKFLTVPTNGCHCIHFEAGQRVKLMPVLEEKLIEYYNSNQDNLEANPKWLKMGKHLSKKESNHWFSLLHMANENSYYPVGTAIIEIDVNEDIEIRGDSLYFEMNDINKYK